jgi:hypothetical protein
VREATVTRVYEQRCGWAMVDKHGELYPHGILAKYRIEGAGDEVDGDYCTPHAIEAALFALNEARRDPGF